MSLCRRVFKSQCVCVLVRACVHVCTCLCVFKHVRFLSVYVCACACVCLFKHTYFHSVCVRVCVRMCTYMDIHRCASSNVFVMRA